MKQKNYLSSSFRKIYGLFQKNLFLRKFKSLMYYLDFFLLIFVKKPKYIDSRKKKVLVVYNMAFGDGVIWRCSSLKLRDVYPRDKYEITLICQNGINKLYENDNTYDNIIAVDFNKSTINLGERFKIFKQIRKVYYDIVLDPVGVIECTTNVLYTRAACGKEKIGMININDKLYCPKHILRKVYTNIIEINDIVSLIKYYELFIKNLTNPPIEFDVGFEKIQTDKLKIKLPKKYYIIFPGASMKLKRWHTERYAELAKRIYNKTKMELVLVGTSADLEAINELKEQIDVPYVDLVGKTSLHDYINIIKKASLVVTNDTSAYHIAVIEETPVAIITGGYTYNKYVEYNFKRKKEFKQPCIIVHNMKCFNCENRCPYLKNGDNNWPCLEKITVDYAWKKIEKLIDEENIGG